jgi:succinate dehydrogenase/fumarate reductase flavoprotein subunit
VTDHGFDYETDLLIFGSGAAGLSAGIFARKRNLRVLICEKMPVIGGTTATAGGFIWVPNTYQAKAAGADDSVDKARTYLRNELGNYYRADLVDAFLEAGPKAVHELQDKTEVVFDYVRWPDYHAETEGGVMEGRTLEPRRYDGRKLGRDFELIRPPIKRLMLLGGMSIDKRKVNDFLNPFSSPGAIPRVLSTVSRFAMDRLKYSRGTDIGAGNALVARMLFTLREQGAEIWVKAPLVELIKYGDRVVGAWLMHDGVRKKVRARQGVLLGTGGFPHNAAMRRELGPEHPHDHSVGWEHNLGEGINAARAVGAAIDKDVVGPGLWQPSSILKHKDGREETILYGYLDRGKPGLIAVDKSGKRFVNESSTYHDIGAAMFRNGVGQGNRFYFICDRRFVWRWGLGMIRPYRPSLSPYQRKGYIFVGNTIEDLARQIDVDAAALADTIRRNNDYARTGVDPEFQRGTNPFGAKMLGDPTVKPNPNLGPIENAPFVALRVYPSTLGTAIGLKTTADAQVMDGNNRPIGGLYASGQDISSVMRGYYPGGGINIGPAIVFAYAAVRHLAGAATTETAKERA